MNNAMNRFVLRAAAALLVAACFNSAQAASIVYEDVDFIKGKNANSESFTIAQSGSYLVTLSDFQFPKKFLDLELSITESKAPIIGTIIGSGTFTFSATAGATYWANIFGIAASPLDIGLYGIRIEQMNSMSAVPVPTSMLMLGSALVAFVGFGRGGWVMRSLSEKGDGSSALFAV